MTYVITEIDRIDQGTTWLVVEDHDVNGEVTRIERTESKPTTEEVNREALAAALHDLLDDVEVIRDTGTPSEQTLAGAVLLLHRFVHGDYSDDTL